MPDADVEVRLDRNTVSASTVVEASAAAVFDFVRRPSNHPAISGDHSVKGAVQGPELLGPGDRFGMDMRIGLPYRVRSKVVEFKPDRLIAWCHFNGHRWRWQIDPLAEDRCRVTETFDLSTARLPAALRLLGFPARHRDNVSRSLANVAAHFNQAPPR